jgi:hypothetical protein
VHDEFPIPTRHQAQNRRSVLVIGRDSGIPVAVRQFFQPCVLAFFALAIAISANGYGYKLSQYLHHAQVSKASGTRMWIEHRDDSSSAVTQLHTKPQKISGLALLAFSAPQLPRLSRDHVVVTPAPTRVAIVVSAHIPFRAPPAFNSSLAYSAITGLHCS